MRFSTPTKMNNCKRPFLIGIAGGQCSGKTSTIEKMVSALNEKISKNSAFTMRRKRPRIAILDLKMFSRLTADNKSMQQHNVDSDRINDCLPSIYQSPEHPSVIDDNLLQKTIENILEYDQNDASSSILDISSLLKRPTNDSTDPILIKNTKLELPVDILFIEGTLSFYYKALRKLMNLRLFVNCDPDIRLVRQVLRDANVRTLPEILSYYATCVKPAFEEYCLPTKKYAHIIIPRGCDNDVAIDLIVQHLQEILIENNNTDDDIIDDNDEEFIEKSDVVNSVNAADTSVVHNGVKCEKHVLTITSDDSMTQHQPCEQDNRSAH
ncbi:hypothetical protein GJ496_007038 [Pomphorhynchus laevis]|nr:hypothetical protein GJ496_005434 [Pomphorhynchus laevis]KAI0984033.1 hypothetical protein GJ496_007038 [Pomphorhynchus laevis]